MSSSDSESVKADNDKQTSSAKRKAAVEEIEVDVNAPEPPSKKARRALKKGKALPVKPSSDDEKEDEDGNKKEKKEKTRSEHGVWIGNLPFKLTAEELRTWLVDNAGGVITTESITRIKLPTVKDASRDKKEKPENKGFAYVDFADVGTKVAAIALSESDLRGRKLLIKDSTSFEGRPEKKTEPEEAGETTDGKPAQLTTEQRQESNASRKVFVGNMSFKTTEEDLSRNFEKCGEIEWAKLATFEDSGKCKGFGWVKFKEPEAAAWAVKGFVKIKEKIETEADFKDEDDSEEEEEKNKANQKQFKTRKWWVNRLLGRELKIELAEDDQLRYKKRFKKDPKKDGETRTPQGRTNRPRDGDERRKPEPAPMKTAQDINVARLTGAVVQHTGTKVTFD
ncbi:Nucleolar protein 13 [Cladobotryum mycophilum]|uniref:Nucleolar protein 13 n=1 Tax=Cladobotryum mycophilum TaxID=491253 RepID=A0ABR0S501_9HYPO